jgi:hypothetical protein
MGAFVSALSCELLVIEREEAGVGTKRFPVVE